MIFNCCNEVRMAAVLEQANLNGIQYLEVLDQDAPAGVPRQRVLLLHCLLPLSTATTFTTDNVLIEGGESVTDIGIAAVVQASLITGATMPPALAALATMLAALPDFNNVLVVLTTGTGDFSTYRLRLVTSAATAAKEPFEITAVLGGFDSQLAEIEFSFKVECGPDFDCAPDPANCPVPSVTTPAINYLAKDYGSFRTVMLDRLKQLLPGWGGASEADLGVALAEVISYVGDHLSYHQDAIATEAYLETARRRVSLRRHALLVDYRVLEGCNARAWIQIKVQESPGVPVFLDRTSVFFYTDAEGLPSSLVDPEDLRTALLSGAQFFEPMHDSILYAEHDTITFYTWGNSNCCLHKGSTEATLRGSYPLLQEGDVLIFEEVMGPETGKSADADIRHRCAVRLTHVATKDAAGSLLVDPLFTDNGNPIQVTEIQWADADGLPFPVCISSTFTDSSTGLDQTFSDVSIVHGNMILADNGLSFSDQYIGVVPGPTLKSPPDLSEDRCHPSPQHWLPVRFRPLLPDGPLTQAVPLEVEPLTGAGNPVTTSVVHLLPVGSISLTDASGFACLSLVSASPSAWPQYFGVLISANGGNPANFNLHVVYNPPGATSQVVVERFTNLSINPADATFAATVINSTSKLITIPATYVPPAVPSSSFLAAPTMLANSGTISIPDPSNPTAAYLEVQATAPLTWASLLGITAQPNATNADAFDLAVVYDPASGVGVSLPVTVEQFTSLLLVNVEGKLASNSKLISVGSVAQSPDSGLSATQLTEVDARLATPIISLAGILNGQETTWSPRQDLLESSESDPDFVVEVESDGSANLRFGDNINGKTPDTATSFWAGYRIQNGSSGNVGPDSLKLFDTQNTRVAGCRNPLPATGGTDAETVEQIRRRAPWAFLTQERAVTMADYEAKTVLDSEVDRASASLRWTGSWYTVFVAVDPKGGGNLSSDLEEDLKTSLERYRLAGQDLEFDSPQYVSLEIELSVCVCDDYFRTDVQEALLEILSNGVLTNGQKAIFHPDNFTFGQTVYLSPIYAAARSVDGVVSIVATVFQPQGVPTSQYLTSGEMKLAGRQIARLDNDRNYPDHGQLTLVMTGGK